MATLESTVRDLRTFNRFYTNLIGVVDRHILDSSFSLTEARILYEIDNDPLATIRKIKNFLQVDEGYMSRTMAKLIRQGLVIKTQAESDGRTWYLSLSSRGREEFRRLNDRSEASIAALTAPLTENGRARVRQIVLELQQLLGGTPINLEEIVIRHDLRPGDIGTLVNLHATLYDEENGYGPGFEAYVAEGAAEFLRRYDPAVDRVWIAEHLGRMIGFLLVMHRDSGSAQLRYFFLLPAYRSLGLGKRLISEAMRFLASAGYRHAYLWTTTEQTSAISLYLRNGFHLTEEKPSGLFGKPLLEQRYDLEILRG